MDFYDPFAALSGDAREELLQHLAELHVVLPEGVGPLVLDLGAQKDCRAGIALSQMDFERVIGGFRLILHAMSLQTAHIALGDVFWEEFRPFRRLLPRGGNISCLRLKVQPYETSQIVLQRMFEQPRIVSASLCRAAFAAFYEDEPRTARHFCVGGSLLDAPRCFDLPFGASAADALSQVDAQDLQPARIVAGSLQTGTMIEDLQAPLEDAVDALILLSKRECFEREDWRCIRCGNCVKACPQDLAPYLLALGRRIDLSACTDCGRCTYECPARVPLSALIAAAQNEEVRV